MNNEGTPPDSRGRIDPILGEEPNAPAMRPAGSTLQDTMGSDLYFDNANFATAQQYFGIPFDQMDRLDLMAMVGKLLADLYQATAKPPTPDQAAAVSAALQQQQLQQQQYGATHGQNNQTGYATKPGR